MGLGERAAEHREILGVDEDRAAIDRAPARDDAIAGDLVLLVHAEIRAAMLHEHVEFLEGAMIEQQIDPLARRQLAALVLSVDARLPTAEAGDRAAFFQRFEDVFHGGSFRSFVDSMGRRVGKPDLRRRETRSLIIKRTRKKALNYCF